MSLKRDQLRQAHGMNFILNALRGGNPDAYYDLYKAHIDPFLKDLRYRFKPEPQRVYRGILLDPAQVEKNLNRLSTINHIRYISFSSDIEIAKLFGDMNGRMSLPYRLHNPNHEGYLIEHLAQPEEIIFHHSWTEALEIEKYFGDEVRVVYEQQEVMIRNTFKTFTLIPLKRGCSNGRIIGVSPG